MDFDPFEESTREEYETDEGLIEYIVGNLGEEEDETSYLRKSEQTTRRECLIGDCWKTVALAGRGRD